MKPTKNFKMEKQTKMMLANIVDPHERGAFKRAMIQAQLHEEEARRQGQMGYLEMFKGMKVK